MNTYRLFRRKARIRMCKDVINNTLLLNSCDLVRQSLAETEADAIIYQTVCPFRTYLPQLQSNFEITKYYCTLLNIYINPSEISCTEFDFIKYLLEVV